MNKLTFNRVFTFLKSVTPAPVRVRNKAGAVSEFNPNIDPLRREITSWQKTFDDGAAFQVGDGTWMSREQFELTLDEKIDR